MTAIRGYKEQYYDLLKEVEEYCQRTGTKPSTVFSKANLSYSDYANGRKSYMLSSSKARVRQVMRDNPDGIKLLTNNTRPPRTARMPASEFRALVSPYLQQTGMLKSMFGRLSGVNSTSAYMTLYANTVPVEAYEKAKEFINDNPDGVNDRVAKFKLRRWTATQIEDAYKAAGCIYG